MQQMLLINKMDELDFILQEGEGLKIEFKESLKNIDKEMVAFANAEGGRIFLGVSDDNKVKGIKIDNPLKSQVQDIANNCDPAVEIKMEKYKDVLVIAVDEGKDKPYKCSSGFYIRQGPNSQKMKRDEIFEFAAKVSKVFFDEMLCEKFNFKEDFDYDKFKAFLRRAKVSDILETKQILVNLNLAKFEKNEFLLNNTGAFLFAKDISKLFYYTTVTCVRFKGNDRVNILDRKDFNTDVINNIENAVKFILQYVPLRYEIKGLHRKEYYDVPESAIREAVVNAVVHRDYFEKGSNVQINVFDNRIEITNPGGLVAGLSKQDFGKKSISRNPLLLSILSKTELVEKIGTGIKRIKEALKKQGLKEPLFEFNGFFTLTFFSPKIEGSVKSSVKSSVKIVELIKKNQNISIPEIATYLNLTTRAVEKNIAKLKIKGILKRVGPAKGGYWEVK